MRVVIGSDHAGFEAKDTIVKQVRDLGHQVQDLGVNGPDSVDYPEYAHSVAEKIADGQAELGILVCGSGIGMSIAANKVPGVRAALCGGEYAARMSRQHNDANILCIGARVTGADLIESMVRIFLATPFEGGRHQRRVDKMETSGAPKQ